eukprot:TRINITY_DN1053_c0_g1_i1.p1 TRINITY_DN1053_c0_g1~~TRINITY_DN1053_c0_g1_i1.p1  ORF type:complete len:438 (+),score=105.80 TRINITY_DN1053_c0_g1_i1:37-1350(+)
MSQAAMDTCTGPLLGPQDPQSPAHPEGVSKEPEGAASNPEVVPKEPEGAASNPEVVPKEPEGAASNSEVVPREPEGAATTPPKEGQGEALEIPHWMQRTKILWGEKRVANLMNAHVLVVGLGGVGGIAAEMIARAGVGRMTIVDNDDVDTTNRNRQVPALTSTIGRPKVDVLAERLKDINPDLILETKEMYLGEGNTYPLVQAHKYSYVLDCIDTLTSKCWLIRACKENNVPIASSMGAGAKTDPTKVTLGDISATKFCKFSSSVRRRLGKWGIKQGVPVVYSTEELDPSRFLMAPPGSLKKTIMGTVSYMPSVFGCMLVSVVLRDIADGVGSAVPVPKLSQNQLKRLKQKEREKEKEKKEKEEKGKGKEQQIKKGEEKRLIREKKRQEASAVVPRGRTESPPLSALIKYFTRNKGFIIFLFLFALYLIKKFLLGRK